MIYYLLLIMVFLLVCNNGVSFQQHVHIVMYTIFHLQLWTERNIIHFTYSYRYLQVQLLLYMESMKQAAMECLCVS